MAKANYLNSLRTACVVLMILLIPNKVEAYNDKGCQGNFREFGTKCTDYIAKDGPKRDPSQECCALIRGADIACMCAHIDPDVEEAISGEKVAYVAKFCGKALPSGSKCGSSRVGVE